MEKTTYLGIDFGTSGCRACVMDASECIIAEHALSLPAPWRDGDEVFQDPNSWWDALLQLLEGLREKLTPSQLSTLAALTIDGTSGTVLLADSQLLPQSAALMYNDSASITEAERIDSVAPADSAARGVSSSLSRTLRLLCEHQSGVRVHSQSDWLLHRLLGHPGAIDSNNALKLGWDAVNRCWPTWMDKLELPQGLLPEVVPAGTPLGTISPEVAAQLGLPDTIRICAGTTDSTAAFIASGASQPGEAVTSLGSTMVLKVLSEKPVFAPEYGVYSQPLGDLWLVGGASNCGGTVLRQYFSDEQLTEMSARINPHRRTCLEYYPLPAPGERFPHNDPARQPKLTPRPNDEVRFLQGILEAMARIERDGYRLLQRLGTPYPHSVRSVGGGSRNPVWSEIRASMLRCQMDAARFTEAANGAALLLLQTLR